MAEQPGHERGVGRQSTHPVEIPLRGWGDILARARVVVSTDNVGLVAAGMAFYSLLAIFPAIAALVSIYGIFADPQLVREHLQAMSGIAPQQALAIMGDQMSKVAASGRTVLGFATGGSILMALWGATKGVRAFMRAMNIAYGEEEKRGLIKQNVIAIALTAFVVIFGVLAVAVIAAVPIVISALPLGRAESLLITLMRWPLIALTFFITLAVLYRFTPSRSDARWTWVAPGSIVAIVLWLLASVLFSVYIRNFASFNETYGSLGAIIAMMMWLWVSSYVVILGAELNAETERQTRRDSTTGRPKPLGQRGAYAADTVGKSRHRTSE